MREDAQFDGILARPIGQLPDAIGFEWKNGFKTKRLSYEKSLRLSCLGHRFLRRTALRQPFDEGSSPFRNKRVLRRSSGVNLARAAMASPTNTGRWMGHDTEAMRGLYQHLFRQEGRTRYLFAQKLNKSVRPRARAIHLAS